MVRVRLRTKFLLSMVLVSAGLTSLSLLLVRQKGIFLTHTVDVAPRAWVLRKSARLVPSAYLRC